MLETPHVIVGATIATKIPNPLIAIPLALASHFLLDSIPHWNPHLNTEIKKYGSVTKVTRNIVIVDVVTALISGFYIASLQMPDSIHAFTILLASFAAVAPDVVEGPYFFLNMKTKFIEKWIRFQKAIQNDAPIQFGMATQVVTVLACLWWIFN